MITADAGIQCQYAKTVLEIFSDDETQFEKKNYNSSRLWHQHQLTIAWKTDQMALSLSADMFAQSNCNINIKSLYAD